MRYFYFNRIENFVDQPTETIIGTIYNSNTSDGKRTQHRAWEFQISYLKTILRDHKGSIFFEFNIPRMGKRIDTVLLIEDILFIIEFKVGESIYNKSALNQVWDYALDLKNFYNPCHKAVMVPVLLATEANGYYPNLQKTSHNDNLFLPICTNKNQFGSLLKDITAKLKFYEKPKIKNFDNGEYSPTPSIIETAISLYNNHSVQEIIKSEAQNINFTTDTISKIIEKAQFESKKSICFVTGVPGAGKTLVGLKVAIDHLDKEKAKKSVYLSGNGPLVLILQEALARDQVRRLKEEGVKKTKSQAKSEVKAFIQNIHHYRDEYIENKNEPYDHVAIFDEAQRAWNLHETVRFMQTKKGKIEFNQSEPEFLISCLDRHKNWAVIVCLVGGGQEINRGEAGISEWLNAINSKFKHWDVYISPNLKSNIYKTYDIIDTLEKEKRVFLKEELHLSVSMRSFRAEMVSDFVQFLLDRDINYARKLYFSFQTNYPITITRDLKKARFWLKEKARGSERYGMIVSSQAYRLKPLAIDVRSPIDPIHWFLGDEEDVRSSYYLEDVATEFQVQGLELDYTCVTWDGDFRYTAEEWKTYSFVGNKWQNINKDERKQYLINAYRVLLTRARQGMVIVVPEGDIEDPTRDPSYYDPTFEYLKSIGLLEL